MRISDWSSDVCSSDLPQRVTRVRKAQLRYEGTDSPLPVDYGSLEEMQAAFEAAHRQRFGFVAVERRLVVEAVAVEVIGATEEVADPERAVEPGARRSEEHTSELQSLMRTSYAVFRLKTKKI